MDAVDRLREAARNEQTVLAMNEMLDLKNQELTRLQSELAEARAENERLKGQEPVAVVKECPRTGELFGSLNVRQKYERSTGRVSDGPLKDGDKLYTAPPDLAAKVASLTKQRDDLIIAVADHVTVRSDQQDRISSLTEQVKVAREKLAEGVEHIEAVACDPDGNVCILGSNEFRADRFNLQDGIDAVREALAKLQGA